MISQERYDRLKEKERLIESETDRIQRMSCRNQEVYRTSESYESTPFEFRKQSGRTDMRLELSYEAVTAIDVTRPELPKDLAAEVIEQVIFL